jgi:integrase
MSRRTPSYCHHKASGQAVVRIDGKDHYLGTFGSVESHRQYDRLIAEWLSHGRRFPSTATPDSLSINELALAYWHWAVSYYRWNERGGACLKDAIRILKDLYGHTPAREFGPRALKACRQNMIGKDWSRTYTNSQVNRLRRIFRWAAEEELLPGSIYENLKAVAGLQQGRTEVRETDKIKPVPGEHVNATLPLMPKTIQAMVQLQQLTGARPTEICSIRPRDIDVRNPSCWVYRPGSDQGPHGTHKTAHHGHDRLILIGPQAQEILRPYLGTKLDAFCFSPRRSEEIRHRRQRERRLTPMTPSQQSRKRKTNRKRGPGERYDVCSYRNAIYRACDKAFPAPVPLARLVGESKKEWLGRLTPEQKKELGRWQREHHWHPNQLRHSRATYRMSIDLSAETVIPLSAAPKNLPSSHTGRPVSFPTVWRWALQGILAADGQRIRLETLKLGGRTVTSMEALQRFAERLSAPEQSASLPRSATATRKASERAAKELGRFGM